MNKALLKKLLSLSILGGLFFTGCEEDDEGFNNGELVGQWEITYYYANRTRVVANPAGVSADTEYRSYFKSALPHQKCNLYCGPAHCHPGGCAYKCPFLQHSLNNTAHTAASGGIGEQ